MSINSACNACDVCPGHTKSMALIHSSESQNTLLVLPDTYKETIEHPPDFFESEVGDELLMVFADNRDLLPDITWAVRCNITSSKEVLKACSLYTRIIMRSYQVFIVVGKAALYQVTGLRTQKQNTLCISPLPHYYFETIEDLLDKSEHLITFLDEVQYATREEE